MPRGSNEQISISRRIIQGVMSRKEAILSADALTDSRFDMSESVVDLQIHSMMSAPLVDSQGQVLGVIQIDTADQRRRFSTDDLEVLVSVADQAAMAVENVQLHERRLETELLERELELAHRVQRGLLPAGPPKVQGYEFADLYEPASHLGGDYFDYIELPGGRLAVTLADVMGKGISAALLMARLSAQVPFCLASLPTPATAVARLNTVFCEPRWEGRFVTFVMLVLDPARHDVTVVNAGHHRPLWSPCVGADRERRRSGKRPAAGRRHRGDLRAARHRLGARGFAHVVHRWHHRCHERCQPALYRGPPCGAVGTAGHGSLLGPPAVARRSPTFRRPPIPNR